MRLPLSWLQKIIPLTQSVEEISDTLTLAGLEVEGIIETKLPFHTVVVGEVVSCEQHPEADKLKVAQVSDGKETFQVVCGGANCRKGIRVALAKVGAELDLPDDKKLKIKKSKLRGVESHGMLCAKEELGLEETSEGIWELDESFTLGTEIDTYFKDTIFDISLTPNLGHCTSVIGVARELSALLNIPYTAPETTAIEDAESPLSISIETDACYRYAGQVLRGITVQDSPSWLVAALENAGMRSVNNVVDITNFVMMELGQPMHAFDAAMVQNETIFVRESTQGETLDTLDDVTREVPRGTLMIYDKNKPLAVAGVMGGLSSSVTDETTDIILESAAFDASAVRKGSKGLNLRSESSSRFEKGIDPLMQEYALKRATDLLLQIAGGKRDGGIAVEERVSYKKRVIPFSLANCNKLLGTDLSETAVDAFFERLEMEKTPQGIIPPSYRNDVCAPIDLIEEVARIYGYNNIPRKSPTYTKPTLDHDPSYTFEETLRTKCIALGLQEFITCDLISPELASLPVETGLGKDAQIPVLKPSSVDQSILRTSLIPGMLACVKHNQDHGIQSISAFEIGKIHFKADGEYVERNTLSFLLVGNKAPTSWRQKESPVDFYTAKGLVENLFDALHIEENTFEKSDFSMLHPGIQASIRSQGTQLGCIGEVHPSICRQLGIDARVYAVQLDMQDLYKAQEKTVTCQPLPQFPGSLRDITLTVPQTVTAAMLLDAFQSVPSKLLKDVTIHDIYESEKIGLENKNVTLRLLYQSESKTLKQEVIDKEHQRIVSSIENFG